MNVGLWGGMSSYHRWPGVREKRGWDPWQSCASPGCICSTHSGHGSPKATLEKRDTFLLRGRVLLCGSIVSPSIFFFLFKNYYFSGTFILSVLFKAALRLTNCINQGRGTETIFYSELKEFLWKMCLNVSISWWSLTVLGKNYWHWQNKMVPKEQNGPQRTKWPPKGKMAPKGQDSLKGCIDSRITHFFTFQL